MNRMRNWLEDQEFAVRATANNGFQRNANNKKSQMIVKKWLDKKLKTLAAVESFVCKIEQRPFHWHVFNFLLFGIPGLQEIKSLNQQLEFEITRTEHKMKIPTD